MTRLAYLVLPLTLISTACAIPGSHDGTGPDRPDPTPDLAAAAGTYQLDSAFDVSASVLLPEQAYSLLQVLYGLRDAPSDTLIGLLDAAGVPLADDLMDALPGALEDRLTGWIDGYVADALAQEPVASTLEQVFATAETVLTRFDVVGELELSAPGADGQCTTTHRIRALHYDVADASFDLEVSPVPSVTEDAATAWISAADAGLDVVIEDHGFGLPYGEYAYAALNQAMILHTGDDLRGTLGALIDCPALAASVANRCVLDVCVGHEAELRSLCEQGLDLAVVELAVRFAGYRFDALRLDAGEAHLSADSAGAYPTLSGGQWQARIDIGTGLRDLTATFTGSRVE